MACGPKSLDFALRILKRIPEGARIHSGKSKTLEDAGIFKELMENERYDFIRRETMKMDRRTQMSEIQKMGATHPTS